jgi:SlyX protein
MPDQRITNLEIQLAHQSEMLDELNDTIVKQWAEIDALKKQLLRTTNRLEQVEDALPENTTDNQPPPHY